MKGNNEMVTVPHPLLGEKEIPAQQFRNQEMNLKCKGVTGKQYVHLMWEFAKELLYADKVFPEKEMEKKSDKT